MQYTKNAEIIIFNFPNSSLISQKTSSRKVSGKLGGSVHAIYQKCRVITLNFFLNFPKNVQPRKVFACSEIQNYSLQSPLIFKKNFT